MANGQDMHGIETVQKGFMITNGLPDMIADCIPGKPLCLVEENRLKNILIMSDLSNILSDCSTFH